jgi:hypothetical protein
VLPGRIAGGYQEHPGRNALAGDFRLVCAGEDECGVDVVGMADIAVADRLADGCNVA